MKKKNTTYKTKKGFNKAEVSAISKIASKTINRQAETKKFQRSIWSETSLSSATACSTPVVLDEVSEGSGSFQRVGDRIKMIGLYLRYIIHNNGSVPVYVRIILYNDKGSGNYASSSNNYILDNSSEATTFTGESLSNIYAPLNKSVIKVWYDKVHRIAGLGDGTGVETTSNKRFFKMRMYKNFQELTAGGTAEQQSNFRILALVRSADNDTTAQTIELTAQSTLYFKDF